MDFVQIGTIGVDAGLIMIGDPVHTLPDGAPRRTAVARDWEEFCHAVADRWYSEPFGAAGALVVRTINGDGDYPVLAEVDDHGAVRRLIIDLDPDEPEVDDIDEYFCWP